MVPTQHSQNLVILDKDLQLPLEHAEDSVLPIDDFVGSIGVAQNQGLCITHGFTYVSFSQ
jgi:hypothetical protein